ncbi:hypothetical protein LOK49_LG02G00868 [Camellia lanceoleosa]|uniref:Uncharacterized protein n=1 Tax=Camellia lanceoleosa TaxID=1840588 RepID=A0ACC0IID9_9ERIC|nr:hypothetical protein LOK49_LG02G00868 [Camellia lanceoleosa]
MDGLMLFRITKVMNGDEDPESGPIFFYSLVSILFDEEDDRRWVFQEAPWSVMGNMLILQPLVTGLPVAEMDFSRSPFWVQVHGLLVEKLTKANGELIGSKIGKLIRVEAHYEGLLLYRNFLRVRVEVDVSKPLPRGFTLTRGGNSQKDGSNLWISFKYERLSDFCFDCGRIGHERTTCKFMSREAGRNSGYGPDLRTGIARSTGLPVEHYRKQVDILKTRVNPLIHRPGPFCAP